MADIQSINPRPVTATEEISPAAAKAAADRAVEEKAVEKRQSVSDEAKAAREELDPEERSRTVERIQQVLSEVTPPEWQVSFREDELTGKMVVELKDAQGETIKQFPPEKMLNLQRKLADLTGVVLDEAH